MKDFNDPIYKELKGGYKIPYDLTIPLAKLNQKDDLNIWDELWENLIHQGDIGEASLVAVPYIINISIKNRFFHYHPFALATCIELARDDNENVGLPSWIKEDYERSLKELIKYGLSKIGEDWDNEILKSILALVAIIKNNRDLARLIFEVDHGEEKQLLDKFFEM